MSALRAGDDCCPGCGRRTLVVAGTGRPHRSESGTVSS
ncbi:hypothetical protein GFS60_07729 (plasmid) [Rhodococcus sp. WAY2]|nr:hypothetical protein GFS60_07729 [Rhodococcus sp. WAY2]